MRIRAPGVSQLIRVLGRHERSMTAGVPVLILVASAGAGPQVDFDRLPLVPGAEDVAVSVVKNEVRVEYDVKEPYPAPATIEFLVGAMEQRE